MSRSNHPSSIDPRDLLERAIALTAQGRHAEALACFDQLLAAYPDDVYLLTNRGAALRALDRHEESLACFERVAALDPDKPYALQNVATSLRAVGRPGQALIVLDRLLVLDPLQVRALVVRSSIQAERGLHSEALAGFNAALKVEPSCLEAAIGIGNALAELKRYEESVTWFDKILRALPGQADALNGRGIALVKQYRYDEALACFDHALRTDPRDLRALANRGILLAAMRRSAEALANFDQALAIEPTHPEVLWNKAREQLACGQLREGFHGMEVRWNRDQLRSTRAHWKTKAPLWLGDSSLGGKIILLHHEQGFGDTIQFCRFVPLVAQQAAGVILRVPQALIELLSTLACDNLRIIAEDLEGLPPHDAHCPLVSLARAFDTDLHTIPATVPYLRPAEEYARYWKDLLGVQRRPRVGFLWEGKPGHPLNRDRSVPLATLLPLLDLPADFISLQRDIPERDQDLLAVQPVARHGETLRNFADSAGLVANLDLIIGVDTAIAHLAGSIGKPVWIMTCHNACWRWLRDRDDSPWYPTARLFRQEAPGDWGAVIETVKQEARLKLTSAWAGQTAPNPHLGPSLTAG